MSKAVPPKTVRLIPARAGNTLRAYVHASLRTAHPRSRGEHCTRLFVTFSGDGSSPLARGTPTPITSKNEPSRLIPARAGNTSSSLRRSVSSPAHPRSRGEHCFFFFARQRPNGSSPLARGTPYFDNAQLKAIRLIPARAGNTTPGGLVKRAGAAHPRSRGEHR